MKGKTMNREQKKIYKNLKKRPGEVFVDLEDNKLYALVPEGLLILTGDEMNADFTKMSTDEINTFILETLSK
jgi:hypothetical protein